MSQAVLSTQALTKHFGSVQAVKGINLEVNKGTIYGMLGPNGSGKTTTLGMLLGSIRPTSGSFAWMGKPGADHLMRRNIGAILEGPIFYPYMTGRENLEVVCLIKDVPFNEIDKVLDWVGLKGREMHRFRTYSLGMKQRLAIGAALLTDPEVLILDEPTNGLDPEGIAAIRGLIRDIASRGKTIVLASHLLDEVQKVCSDFCVLRKGSLIYQGSVADALNSQAYMRIGAADISAVSKALVGKGYEMESVEGLLELRGGEIDPGALNRFCFDQGIVLTQLEVVRKSLEDQFLQILKENDQATATH